MKRKTTHVVTSPLMETLEERLCMSASHPGGVNVSMGDGSVRFISSSIQATQFTDGTSNTVLIALLLPAVQK